MTDRKFEDIFEEEKIAQLVMDQLHEMKCVKKDGSWKGISGNKMEIVALLDSLDNLNVLKPLKNNELAGAFCSQFGLKLDEDISMKLFYLTPPLKDYFRFRSTFKELLLKARSQSDDSKKKI